MQNVSYITILATLITIIVISLIFAYFYTDLKKMIAEKEININLSVLPKN